MNNVPRLNLCLLVRGAVEDLNLHTLSGTGTSSMRRSESSTRSRGKLSSRLTGWPTLPTLQMIRKPLPIPPLPASGSGGVYGQKPEPWGSTGTACGTPVLDRTKADWRQVTTSADGNLQAFSGPSDRAVSAVDRRRAVVIRPDHHARDSAECCYAKGVTNYFYEHQVRIFHYPKWAEPLRDAIQKNMERLAAENQIKIEFVRSKKSIRKEQPVKEVLEKRGEEPGLACILSAVEPCGSYKPWHDKKTHKTYLKPDDGKCLYYYVYFIDPDLALCCVRVPTWSRFRLQVYCNGHSYLARQLSRRNIECRVLDNALGWIADLERAQKLADQFSVEMLHRKLDEFADRYCPVIRQFGRSYHWTLLDQVEFATDVVSQRPSDAPDETTSRQTLLLQKI